MSHPEIDVETKIEILKEVEDKREYHAVRLIDELEIDHKDKLRKEYKELSRLIHPSHKQILLMREKLTKRKKFIEEIDCKEISKIHQSTRVMYDIFFFLFITHFPEMKESLMKNSDFVKDIKFYRLRLTSRALNVRLINDAQKLNT